MLYERGFIKRFTTIWYGSLFPRCLGDVVHAPPPLNLQDVSTAFMILLLGLLLCSVIFCGERAWLYFLLLYDWNHVWNNYSYPCRNCNVLRNKKHVRSSPDLFRWRNESLIIIVLESFYCCILILVINYITNWVSELKKATNGMGVLPNWSSNKYVLCKIEMI